MKKLLWFIIIGLLTASILPNIYVDYWLIDILSNFKLQYFFIAILLVLIVALLLKQKTWPLVLLVLSILWNGYYIAPYYLYSKDTVGKVQNSLKIISINLLSNNSETELVRNYIEKEDPDILILMEFTPRWEIALSPILNTYQYKKLVSRNDNFGIAMLSKFKMKSSTDYLDLNNKPSILGDISIENKRYSILATHPVPPVSQTSFINRNKQLKNIIEKRDSFSNNLLVIGDFNTSSFSNHFNKLVQGDLKDSRIGFGLLPTWPSNFPILQTTLDHCLVSENLKVIERSTGENIGSDHLPVKIVFGIK